MKRFIVYTPSNRAVFPAPVRLHPSALSAVLLSGVFTWFSCQQNPPAANAPQPDNQPKERTENYGNGAISRRYQEINGRKEGKMTDYYIDGRVKAERLFKDDIQVGRSVFYYPGGQIKEVQYYGNGKKQGGDTLFYENGRPEFVVEYQDEKKNGYLRKWAPDGAVVIEAKYAMDSLVEVKGKPVHLEYPADLGTPKGKH